MSDLAEEPDQDGTPPSPPGLSRLAGDSLVVIINPNTTFSSLAQLPPPSYGVMIANIILFNVVLFGINLLYAATNYPAAIAAFGPVYWLVSAIMGIVFAVLGCIFAAGLVHILAMLAGGRGTFERSFQVLAVGAALAPIGGISFFFAKQVPGIWILPSVLGLVVTVSGVVHLHGSGRPRTWGVFAPLVALILLVQWFVMGQLERFSGQAETLRASAAKVKAPDWRQGLPASTPLLIRKNPPAPARSSLLPITVGRTDRIRDPGSTTVSIPGNEAPPGNPFEEMAGKMGTKGKKSPSSEDMERMLDQIMPMINNPAVFQFFPPEKRKHMKTILGSLEKMQEAKRSGRTLTPAENAEIQRKMEVATAGLMGDEEGTLALPGQIRKQAPALVRESLEGQLKDVPPAIREKIIRQMQEKIGAGAPATEGKK